MFTHRQAIVFAQLFGISAAVAVPELIARFRQLPTTSGGRTSRRAVARSRWTPAGPARNCGRRGVSPKVFDRNRAKALFREIESMPPGAFDALSDQQFEALLDRYSAA